ncbi:MAG TPA: hypothetical protein VFN09_05865 [Rhodanobacteraceae bacterium]|nr:hypothetical protein [Rhodanobacteraceae bacterium]
MNRRRFLYQSFGAGAATLAWVPLAASASTATPEAVAAVSRFRLWRIADDSRLPSSTSMLRVHLERLVQAPKPVLASLQVHALFDIDGLPQPCGFLAWSYRAEDRHGNSTPTRFEVPVNGVRSLRLDYTLRASAGEARQECCRTVPLLRPRWQPGRYVLAGPRADGRAADAAWHVLRDAPDRLLRADGSAVDFDYLSLRVEAATV